MTDDPAARRWLVMVATRLAGVAGALLGLVLIARAPSLGVRVLGLALVVSALVVMAIVPRSLARRWRTPPAP